MSHVSISKSYAVLVGLEVYAHTRRKVKMARRSIKEHKDKVLHPGEAAAQADETEAKFLEWKDNEKQLHAQQEELERDENAFVLKIMRKLHINPSTPKHRATPPQPTTPSVATGGEAQRAASLEET